MQPAEEQLEAILRRQNVTVDNHSGMNPVSGYTGDFSDRANLSGRFRLCGRHAESRGLGLCTQIGGRAFGRGHAVSTHG